MQPIKKVVIQKRKKNQKKSQQISILENADRFSKISLRGVLTSYRDYIHTKFGMNRPSRLGVSLYSDRQTDSQTDKFCVLLLLEITLYNICFTAA